MKAGSLDASLRWSRQHAESRSGCLIHAHQKRDYGYDDAFS